MAPSSLQPWRVPALAPAGGRSGSLLSAGLIGSLARPVTSTDLHYGPGRDLFRRGGAAMEVALTLAVGVVLVAIVIVTRGDTLAVERALHSPFTRRPSRRRSA